MQCITCQAETTNPKFCSMSCAAKYNNTKHPKRRPEHACKNCDKMITSGHNFCSLKCKSYYRLKKQTFRTNALTAKCSSCKSEYPNTPEFFFRKGDRLSSRCKQCHMRDDYATVIAKKKKLVDLLGGKCIICNYSAYFGALDFHHLDPSQKEMGLANGRNRNFELMKKEAAKCILVCATCHREIHGGLHPQYLVPPVGVEPTIQSS